MLHEPGEGGSVTADRQPDNRLLVGQWLDARRRGSAIGLGHRLPIITSPAAGVAESADASVSNTDEGNLVWVQLPPPAPTSRPDTPRVRWTAEHPVGWWSIQAAGP